MRPFLGPDLIRYLLKAARDYDASASIRIFAWLDNPRIIFATLPGFELFAKQFHIGLRTDMVSEWNVVLARRYTVKFIETLHAFQQRLFVADVAGELQVVVHSLGGVQHAQSLRAFGELANWQIGLIAFMHDTSKGGIRRY
jgi:hypothetical protein